MVRLAELLSARGLRVGLITNDQSRGLVDTATVAAGGFAVREITDGCFCCRFGSLIEAAESLTLEVRPDVFLAEPVGSCTDLRATVQLPLARLYGDAYRVAPLSVLVDPLRAARAFGIDPGPQLLVARALHLRQAARGGRRPRAQQDRHHWRRAARRPRGGPGAALSERRDRERERSHRVGAGGLARATARDSSERDAPDHGRRLRPLRRRRVAARLGERHATCCVPSATSTATSFSAGWPTRCAIGSLR